MWPKSLQKESIHRQRRKDRAVLLMEAASKKMVAKSDVTDLKKRMQENKRAQQASTKWLHTVHQGQLANTSLLTELNDNIARLRDENKAIQGQIGEMKAKEESALAAKQLAEDDARRADETVIESVWTIDGNEDEDQREEEEPSSPWQRALNLFDCGGCIGDSSMETVAAHVENSVLGKETTTKAGESSATVSTITTAQSEDGTIGTLPSVINRKCRPNAGRVTTPGQTTSIAATVASSATKTCYDLPTQQSTNLGRRMLQ